MKATSYLLVLVLLVITTFTSCKKSDDIVYQSDFDKSYKAWSSFKAQSNNSYSYVVTTSSWTGYNTATTITVLNGEVVNRKYRAWSTNFPAAHITTHADWEETKSKLNTHDSAAATLTLDDIYQTAKTVWLKKRADVHTSFEAKNNGIISSCGYVEKGCADDCFIGIAIASVTSLDDSYKEN